MIDAEKEYGEVFRMEFRHIQESLTDPRCSNSKPYLIGVSDGIAIMASHLGIALRPDPLEDVKE